MSPAASELTQEPLLQAGAIPFRFQNGQLQICLITSAKKQSWIVPKGIIDPGETAQQTALKEALEEAGLIGRIVGEAVGQYEYSKWNRHLKVTVFLMEVTRTQEQWPEQASRQRQWLAPPAAVAQASRPELKTLIGKAIARLEA